MLVKGINVLRAISEHSGDPSFTDLQKKMDIPKGTLHRILQALMDENLVFKSNEDKYYKLGFGLLRLANAAISEISLRDVASDELVRLHKTTNETINLVAFDNMEAVVVDRAETTKAVRAFENIGINLPLHCTAAGKAIAAFLAESDLDMILSRFPLRKFTDKTIRSSVVLKKHLVLVRNQGFALNIGETDPDVFGVAAPIFNVHNNVVGSINLTAPSYQLEACDQDMYIQEVVLAAGKISGDMGATSSCGHLPT